MSEWNYNRIGEDGRLYSYYGKLQKWTYTSRGREHTIQITNFVGRPNGVQYYWVSIDGKFYSERLSAARLHYFLHSKQAQEIASGELFPMPLQIEEVQAYFTEHTDIDCHYIDFCDICACDCGTDGEKICKYAYENSFEIKKFNAEKRIKDIIQRF